LYIKPQQILVAQEAKDLPSLFDAIRAAGKVGKHVAGFLAYEAGFALEPRVASLIDHKVLPTPLAWFGVFAGYQEIAAEQIPAMLPASEGAWLGRLQPQISRADYGEAFEQIQNYITAGDIYQANLTFRANLPYAGDPVALYAAIRPRAAAGYGGLIWTGEDYFLSFSPELFFALRDRRITTKPMKGTAVRHRDPAEDAAAAVELRADPKQRAENLMIVDLLRNDLSRVAEKASVAVPELFTVESYPTVHTMTSTVTAQLAEGLDAVDLIRAIFPCGSITGAPKIRAMEIIDDIETAPRGIYCGSIGRVDANGDAAFNVAIRTLHLKNGDMHASVGLGSGVVADSSVQAEWDECLAKGKFARVQRRSFDLIETMRFTPASGIARLELHLDRMKASAQALEFQFDRHEARNRLHAATFHLDADAKVRLLASPSGELAIQISPIDATPEVAHVAIIPLPVEPSDFRLRHKITDRAFYDDSRKASRADEVLFVDAAGYLTEGSISAIFVKHDGKLLTPPLSRGLLPSVLRAELIESGEAIEADLRAEDLAGGFFLGNSVLGLFAAKL
jgi:para-aminobenzoate synthetase / 4-amino-4-deoxychorismate lyase